MLKYRLLVTRDSYPRSHSLRTLTRILSQDAPRLISLVEDTDKLHYVARLEAIGYPREKFDLTEKTLPMICRRKKIKKIEEMNANGE